MNCVDCGGPKPGGKGRRKCDPCQSKPRKIYPRTPEQAARHNAEEKARYAANPQRFADYQRNRRNEHRAYWVEHLGGRCAFCGDTADLQFDHKDWRTKKFEVSKTPNSPNMAEEMAKCQLLCEPCHKVKTAGDKRLMRGLASGY